MSSTLEAVKIEPQRVKLKISAVTIAMERLTKTQQTGKA
jgi:hypothetical protein